MTFFPILKKNPNLAKKNNKHSFWEDWDFHSVNSHTSYMVAFSFNLMAIVCVISIFFFFLLTKNDIIVHNNKFPNLGVCCANFPDLKGHGAPSQNHKKISGYVL